MATRVGILGWEANDATVDGYSLAGSGATIDSTTKRTGSYALKIVSAAGVANYCNATNVSSTTTGAYHRFYVMVTSLPSSAAKRILGGTESAGVLGFKLNTTGTVQLFINTTGQGTSTVALTDTSKWYRFELFIPSGTGDVVLKIDGNTEITYTTGSALSYTKIFGDVSGGGSGSYTAFFDDYVIDTAGYPGDSNVALALPISDNARAAKWTGGAGGTTNLFAAVDNKPPAGVASASATDTSQIEHSGGGAGNEDYDANMTTYANLGIGASDTVNAVRALFVDGEDIATGTKTLTYGVKSNPAGSFETNFSAGSDVGAAGTYPTNWSARRGTIINSPSVTIANSPVVTARRPSTESRVASVCFMGLYVDYTPAAAAAPTARPFLQANQSVMRAANW